MRVLLCIVLLFGVGGAIAQESDSLEQGLRSGLIKQIDAWNRRDFDAMDWEASYPRGFGYRTKAPRMASDIPQENRKQFLEEWIYNKVARHMAARPNWTFQSQPTAVSQTQNGKISISARFLKSEPC